MASCKIYQVNYSHSILVLNHGACWYIHSNRRRDAEVGKATALCLTYQTPSARLMWTWEHQQVETYSLSRHVNN